MLEIKNLKVSITKKDILMAKGIIPKTKKKMKKGKK